MTLTKEIIMTIYRTIREHINCLTCVHTEKDCSDEPCKACISDEIDNQMPKTKYIPNDEIVEIVAQKLTEMEVQNETKN